MLAAGRSLPQDLQIACHNVRLLTRNTISTQRPWRKIHLCSSGATTCSSRPVRPSSPVSLVLCCGTGQRCRQAWIGALCLVIHLAPRLHAQRHKGRVSEIIV
jgi:hypothetical protein